MFGISFPELLLIMAIVLVVFGPERLPEMARSVGKLMGELRKNSDAVRREFYNAVYKPAENFQKELDSGARNLVTMPEQPPSCKQGTCADAKSRDEST